MPKLSVVVLTKNEEKNIKECLEGVKWADEIVIIDDFSADRTLDIAGDYTTKIFKHTMEGFGQQRNFGIEKAGGEWIYFVDADDRVTPQLRDEILAVIQNPKYNAYQVYQKSDYLGKWIMHCGWYAPVMKLLKKGKAKFSDEKAVEKPIVEGEFGYLTNPVLHFGYPDIATHLRKLCLYSRYEAEQMFKKGIVFKWHDLLLRPGIKFVHKYIFLSGYKEGIHGFILCSMSAIYAFFTYLTLWEKNKNKSLKDAQV